VSLAERRQPFALRRWPALVEQRAERATIDVAGGKRVDTQAIQDRRQDVDRLYHLLHGSAARHAWPHPDQGDVRQLAVEVAVVVLELPVLAELLSVVRHQDHVGAVLQVQVIQRAEQSPELVIHEPDLSIVEVPHPLVVVGFEAGHLLVMPMVDGLLECQVELARYTLTGEPLPILLGHRAVGCMDVIGMQEHEERQVPMFIEPADDGLKRAHPVNPLVAIEVMMETLSAVQVAAVVERHRVVALRLHDARHGAAIGGQRQALVDDSVPRGVGACEHRIDRRQCPRRLAECVLEDDTARSERGDLGRRVALIAVGIEVIGAHPTADRHRRAGITFFGPPPRAVGSCDIERAAQFQPYTSLNSA